MTTSPESTLDEAFVREMAADVLEDVPAGCSVGQEGLVELCQRVSAQIFSVA